MIFLLTVCSAVLIAGSALKCEVCYSLSSNSCSGQYTSCDSFHDRCMETLTQTTVGGLESVVLEKSCGSLYNCTHPASLTAPEFGVSVTTTCCNTDYCNNRTMNWTPKNTTLNGVTCPSCFARDAEKCDKMTALNCTGIENHCIQFTVSRQKGSTITMAGCASENMQSTQGRAAFSGNSIRVSGFRILNGGESLRSGFHLPILAILTAVTISARR
ncbi:phospholipase A2 inhibitor and Ly6/PLAUR domain-containing protein-like [Pelodytes ibericus]